ncbi:HD domain-containing protein [Microbispora bryophytorum]|uniref:HD domain-containing protein n=1 Tax=Microbispora bryophytorum TaxID=1460882 RepID=UPI0033E1CC98
MSYTFEETPLWRRTLASRPNDPHAEQRQSLRFAYLQFRTVAEALAGEIAVALPMFTDHSIRHADALWDIASQLCGEDFPINPAEAFVLGGAFLLHDLGMGLAAYPGGLSELENDQNFDDLVATVKVRLQSIDPSVNGELIGQLAREEAIAELLRLRHAAQAERLVSTQFHTSGGEILYLLQDAALRQTFGELIGQIAYSHWWPVDQLRDLPQRRGAYTDHPGNWELNPLKIACVLRLADASQIDSRRAPVYTHAFRRPKGVSRDHWYFQERLTRPLVVADRFVYTSTRSFGRDEAAAWWLAFETIQTINQELRQVDALCADIGLPRFVVRSIAGADAPARLAEHIKTDGWKPIDARLRVGDAVQLVSSIGGEDLYGQRPDIAVRELIANASDASRARAAHEGGPLRAVTVRLSEENGAWWLSVEDQGIGMSPETMVTALTDFGHSHWRSSTTLSNFPGLLAKGFEPAGKFGIGFFAVFMAADEVQVRSLPLGEAPRSTHVLEFNNGVAGRPLLREATRAEWLSGPGTVVRARLKRDPRTLEGIFRTDSLRWSHTQCLHAELTNLCALAEVDIQAQGPDDPAPIRIVSAGDWREIPAAELFKRIYLQWEQNPLYQRVLEHYQNLFIDHATTLVGDNGDIVGRAMLSSGEEHILHSELNSYFTTWGWVYVGGLRSAPLRWSMGAFQGRPLTANRLTAFPMASPENFRNWAESQAKVARSSRWSTPGLLWVAADLVHGFGGIDHELPCADCGTRLLNRRGLKEWLLNREEILLISEAELLRIDQHAEKAGRRCLFFSTDGVEVRIPENALVVDIYPRWLFPEEIAKRPRDPKFAKVAANADLTDPRYWWYNNGSFGAIATVIDTIAESWGIEAGEVVKLLEACSLTNESDTRLELPTTDGRTFLVDAIRLRRSKGER